MKLLLSTLLLLALAVSSADAQSFYRRKNKFHHAYMAKATTGAVLQPQRPGTSEDFRMYGDDFKHNEFGSKSMKEMRKEQHRQEKAAKKAARLAKHDQKMKLREERGDLGAQLAFKEPTTNRHFR